MRPSTSSGTVNVTVPSDVRWTEPPANVTPWTAVQSPSRSLCESSSGYSSLRIRAPAVSAACRIDSSERSRVATSAVGRSRGVEHRHHDGDDGLLRGHHPSAPAGAGDEVGDVLHRPAPDAEAQHLAHVGAGQEQLGPVAPGRVPTARDRPGVAVDDDVGAVEAVAHGDVGDVRTIRSVAASVVAKQQQPDRRDHEHHEDREAVADVAARGLEGGTTTAPCRVAPVDARQGSVSLRSVGLTEDLETVRGWVTSSNRIVVLTGAGISTDSGIRRLPGAERRLDEEPGGREGRPHLDTTCPTPRCGAGRGRRRSTRPTLGRQPNAGHQALVDLERTGGCRPSDHPEHRRAPPAAGSEPRPRRRGPRHDARGHVHGVRRAGPDGASPRPGAGRRGRPAVPLLRRDPQVGHDQLRAGPRGRRPPAGRRRRARVRPAARGRAPRSVSTPSPTSCPLAAASGARVVIVNDQPHGDGRPGRRRAAGSIADVLPTPSWPESHRWPDC